MDFILRTHIYLSKYVVGFIVYITDNMRTFVITSVKDFPNRQECLNRMQ